MFSLLQCGPYRVFHLLGTVTLRVGEKSSRYAAILWLLSGQLDHEVLGWGNPDRYYRFPTNTIWSAGLPSRADARHRGLSNLTWTPPETH
jgi:hypothetical protein